MECHTSGDESDRPGQQEEEIRERKARAQGPTKCNKITKKQAEVITENSIST
jgi:hypothetical protein